MSKPNFCENKKNIKKYRLPPYRLIRVFAVMLFPRSFSLSDLAMDFIEPVFGNRCIQYMNGEEAKLRRQRYDYYMNSEFVSMYFPSFAEVSQALHTWY